MFDAGYNLSVTLTVPETVQEGEPFFPQVSISQEVCATFILQAQNGSAKENSDFSLHYVNVEFASNGTLASPASLSTLADNLVEPNEAVLIQVELSGPLTIAKFVTYTNQVESVIIIDSNSECACHRTVKCCGKDAIHV